MEFKYRIVEVGTGSRASYRGRIEIAGLQELLHLSAEMGELIVDGDRITVYLDANTPDDWWAAFGIGETRINPCKQ